MLMTLNSTHPLLSFLTLMFQLVSLRMAALNHVISPCNTLEMHPYAKILSMLENPQIIPSDNQLSFSDCTAHLIHYIIRKIWVYYTGPLMCLSRLDSWQVFPLRTITRFQQHVLYCFPKFSNINLLVCSLHVPLPSCRRSSSLCHIHFVMLDFLFP